MASEDSGISIALTPVQLYAMLNGRSISPGELASNTWHEMPSAANFSRLQAFLNTPPLPSGSAAAPPDPRVHTSHTRNPNVAECWRPPAVHAPSATAITRGLAVLTIISGGLETAGGVLLILTPEPTMLTKVGGTVLAAHGLDTTQAAIRQLFSGKPVADLTQTGATWAAHEAGASDKTAHRIGVILDVAVPLAATGALGVERALAIRSGRIILSEDAVAGKAGRVSLDAEEADKAAGKEGGHTLRKHVDVTDADIKKRALANANPNAVVSRFASKQLAEDAINDAIKANREAMRRWALRPVMNKPPQAFFFEARTPVGTAYIKATDSFESVKGVRVILNMSRSGNKLLYVLTAYPEP